MHEAGENSSFLNHTRQVKLKTSSKGTVFFGVRSHMIRAATNEIALHYPSSPQEVFYANPAFQF